MDSLLREERPQPMPPARPGDALTPQDLDTGFRFLTEQARALNAEVAAAESIEAQRRIGRVQNQLLARAAELNARSIDLLAGEARITAEHIGSAVGAAQAVVDRIADIRQKLQKLGAVLDFFAAVLTGNGRTIVEGAQTLKQALSAT